MREPGRRCRDVAGISKVSESHTQAGRNGGTNSQTHSRRSHSSPLPRRRHLHVCAQERLAPSPLFCHLELCTSSQMIKGRVLTGCSGLPAYYPFQSFASFLTPVALLRGESASPVPERKVGAAGWVEARLCKVCTSLGDNGDGRPTVVARAARWEPGLTVHPISLCFSLPCPPSHSPPSELRLPDRDVKHIAAGGSVLRGTTRHFPRHQCPFQGSCSKQPHSRQSPSPHAQGFAHLLLVQGPSTWMRFSRSVGSRRWRHRCWKLSPACRSGSQSTNMQFPWYLSQCFFALPGSGERFGKEALSPSQTLVCSRGRCQCERKLGKVVHL